MGYLSDLKMNLPILERLLLIIGGKGVAFSRLLSHRRENRDLELGLTDEELAEYQQAESQGFPITVETPACPKEPEVKIDNNILPDTTHTPGLSKSASDTSISPAPYLDIIRFQDRYGEESSALTLTSNLIFHLNINASMRASHRQVRGRTRLL